MTTTPQAAPATTTSAAAPQKKSAVNSLKDVLEQGAMRKQIESVLGEKRNTFTASLIELVRSDKSLQQCEPAPLIMEALKAAALDLPIIKSLGYAFVIAYNVTKKDASGRLTKGYEPTFQIGYKGLYQLAMRSGQYRTINAGAVYEGELRNISRLTGDLDLSGQRTSDRVVGYFAYLELLNGYRKSIYMTVEEMAIHAKRYSKALMYNKSATLEALEALAQQPLTADGGAVGWLGNFHSMAIKTVLRILLSKYGLLSIELQNAIDSESDTTHTTEDKQYTSSNQTTQTFEAMDVEYEEVTSDSPDTASLPQKEEPLITPDF